MHSSTFLPVKYILKSDLSKFSTPNNLRYKVVIRQNEYGILVITRDQAQPKCSVNNIQLNGV